MNSRGGNRKRLIHKRDSLRPELLECLLKVLAVAADDLQSNLFLFLDINAEVNPPSEQYGKIYGSTSLNAFYLDACFHPVHKAVMVSIPMEGTFPAVIWISHVPLSPTAPQVFRTGVFAHELAHARQIEDCEDVFEAWEYYSHFLNENQQLPSYWEWPLEIDAELYARRLIRDLHPGASLNPLLNYYQNYTPVLQFESSGGFDLLEYFRDIIRRGPPGFREWALKRDRMWRTNSVLLQLASELGLTPEDFA